MSIDIAQITRPELWTLRLELRRRTIAATLHAPAQEGSMIWDVYDLPESPDSALASFEAAIYEHPVLLEGFAKTQVLIDATHFVVIPPQLEPMAQEIMDSAFPDDRDERQQTITCPLPQCHACIAMNVDDGLPAFLQRTFSTPLVAHSLMPLCEHTATLGHHDNTERMMIHIEHRRLAIAAFNGPKLLMANTYSVRNADDAAFMALHACHSLELDTANAELLLAGDNILRDNMTDILRRYANHVVPASFPTTAISMAHDAIRAPYNLILLALCEL